MTAHATLILALFAALVCAFRQPIGRPFHLRFNGGDAARRLALQDGDGPPWSEATLAALSRSDLQALAKAHNVKANGKSGDIIAGLLQQQQQEAEPEQAVPGRTDASEGIAHRDLDEILRDQGVRLDDIFALRDAIMQAKEASGGDDDDDILLTDDDDGDDDDIDDDNDDQSDAGGAAFDASTRTLSPGSAKSIADLVAQEAQAVERAKANKAKSDAIKERKRLEKEKATGQQPRTTSQPPPPPRTAAVSSGARGVAAAVRPPPPPRPPTSPTTTSGPEVVRWRNGAIVSGPGSSASAGSSAVSRVAKPVNDRFADAYFEEEEEVADKGEAPARAGREQTPASAPAKAYAGPDLLEGVTLKAMVEYLEDAVGFEGLYAATQLRCFNFKPSVASALKVRPFLIYRPI
jgi:hypothetical protein